MHNRWKIFLNNNTHNGFKISNKRRNSYEESSQALSHHHYASVIDVFTGMGILQLSQVNDWRKGKIPYLERVALGSLGKISRIMKAFHKWAEKCRLHPRETVYLSRTKVLKEYCILVKATILILKSPIVPILFHLFLIKEKRGKI